MAGGLKMQAGARHSFSTHIALNCNVGTRLELKKIEKHRNRQISSIPRVIMPIGVGGRSRELRM